MQDLFSVKKWYCRRKETQIRNQHRKLSLEVPLPKVSDDFQFPRQLRPWYPSGTDQKVKLFRSRSFTIQNSSKEDRQYENYRENRLNLVTEKICWCVHFWTYPWGVPRTKLSRKLKVVTDFRKRHFQTQLSMLIPNLCLLPSAVSLLHWE